MFKAKDFQRKATGYITQIGIYSFIQHLKGQNSERITQQCLINIIDRAETTLYALFCSKCLTKFQYNTMKPNRSQVQLNYLYFVPETNQVGSDVYCSYLAGILF